MKLRAMAPLALAALVGCSSAGQNLRGPSSEDERRDGRNGPGGQPGQGRPDDGRGQNDGRTGGRDDGRNDGRGQNDGRTGGRDDGRNDGRGQNDGRTGGRDDGRNDGRNDGRWNDGRNDGRIGDRDGRHDGRPGPGGAGRQGRFRQRHGDNRNCVRCFDRRRFSDDRNEPKLGGESTLWNDHRRGPTQAMEQRLMRPVCGIKSVSVEVLDNEAKVTKLEVHYAGDSMFRWDNVRIQADWDFRTADEGEQSDWFDVGDERQNDRVCIDGVRVSGFTYQDNFFDKTAKVQVYGSTTRRGRGGFGPGPGPGPGFPPPRPEPRVISQPAWASGALMECINALPVVGHPDDMISDSIFTFNLGKLYNRCENQRDMGQIRRLERDGFTCTKQDAVTSGLAPVGQLNRACLDSVLSKITKQDKIKREHRRRIEAVCSEQRWDCSKTVY